VSSAGALTAGELTSFNSGGRLFRLRNDAAVRWLGFARELTAAFGFAPTLTWASGLPSGGYRTIGEQRIINPALGVGDHTWGYGHDIYNQRSFRNANEPLFLAICAKWGLRFTVLPSEPWHARQVFTTLPAGLNVIPIESAPAPTPSRKRLLMGLPFTVQYGNDIFLNNGVGEAHLLAPSHVQLFKDDELNVLNGIRSVQSYAEKAIKNVYIAQCNSQIVVAVTGGVNAPLLAAIADVKATFKPVDAAAVGAQIAAVLKVTLTGLDPEKVAAAVTSKLASNFAAVAAAADKQTTDLTKELAKVGKIDKSDLSDALAAAFPEYDPNVFADAVYTVIKPELVKLELKNQLAK
jgi:hypothetical protein